jgi:predicted DNA-binding protein
LIRTQIQLTEEQSQRLQREARRSGRSVAEVIRQSVEAYLDQEQGRALGAPSRETAAQVAGLFHSGKSDVAARHDDYLDEAYAG